MKKLLSFLTFICFLNSCVFIHSEDSIDLGDKYRYIQDYPQVIIYNTSSQSKGTGINIVPPLVKSYNFNERYIIAKSQELDEMTGKNKGNLQYWIIDKAENAVLIEPMDSISFYTELLEKKISLRFKK